MHMIFKNNCETPLISAVIANKIDIVKFLVEEAKAKIDIEIFPHYNAIKVAEIIGHSEIKSYLKEDMGSPFLLLL